MLANLKHRPLWHRTLIRMFGFASSVSLFGICALVSCASPRELLAEEKTPAPQAAPDKPAQPEPQPQPPQPGQPQPPQLTPEEEALFKQPLSGEGITPGVAPSALYKCVILIAPNPNSWQDYTPLELAGDSRAAAIAFESVLEQQLDYKSHLWREDGPRQRRYYARLRFVDFPAVDTPIKPQALPPLEQAAACFNADIVFFVRFTPAPKETATQCLLWRYRRSRGIDLGFKFDLPALGIPDANSASRLLQAQGERAVAGIVPPEEEAKNCPVPPLVANDAALKHFVEMRTCFMNGDLNGAWIGYADLLSADPKCGRAALFGMEIFRNHSTQTSPLRAAQEGIKGVLATPNDALLRGRLAYNVSIWFKKREWALAALNQALTVQPRSFAVLVWVSMVISDNDKQKQKAYLLEHALPHFKDGRVEVAIGNIEALSDKLQAAVDWYAKARIIAPDDHEACFSFALIGTHHAEKLQRGALIGEPGDKDRAAAIALFDESIVAWNHCLQLDVTEQSMVLEFYVRAATRDFKYLPTDEQTLNRLFLIQSVRNGLGGGAGGNNFGKIAGHLLETQRELQRILAKEAKAGDADYELSLCARLNFALADSDLEDAAIVMREMRRLGYRGSPYPNLIGRFQPLIDAAEEKERDEKEQKK